jgi:hypothetical protein
MKNIKEKWVTKRGLITALKGREEREGARQRKLKQEKGWLRKEGSYSGMRAG